VSDIEVEIGALLELDLAALRKKWRALYLCEPPRHMSRELLLRAIAYQLQEEHRGRSSRSTLLRLRSASSEHGGKRTRVRKDRKVKPGTRFLREWNDQVHEVIAASDGAYLYRGVAYRSLSAIAREITGTRWSGPAFFGLSPPLRKADAEN